MRAQRVRCGRRGGIAGNDQGMCAFSNQEIGDHEGALADEVLLLLAIGKVAGIRYIDDVQPRHTPAHLQHDRQATHAGIEDAHQAVLGHAGCGLQRQESGAAMILPDADSYDRSDPCLLHRAVKC